MLSRELTYQVPFARLMKLSRTMSRKAYASTWWATWILIAAFVAVCFIVPSFEPWLEELGWPVALDFPIMVVLFISGLLLIRVQARKLVQARIDYDEELRFRQETDGVRISARSVEYFLKWPGITQILIEPDGLVLSHGNLFFLVPDRAFDSFQERDELVRELFAKLGEEAKLRSVAHLQHLLATTEGRA